MPLTASSNPSHLWRTTPPADEQRNILPHGVQIYPTLVWLVGGFATSDWLFAKVQEYFLPLGIRLCRPDAHVNKAVADGAVSFYIDHLVSSRVARATYGTECNNPYDSQNPEHQARQHTIFTGITGSLRIPSIFRGILLKGTQVSELCEFRKPFYITRTSLTKCESHSVDIMRYGVPSRSRGG